MPIIKSFSDLKNNYNEISKMCKETRESVIITVNGHGDTVIMSLEDYNQMIAELELLRILFDSEDDVKNGRVKPIESTFKELVNKV